MKTYYRLEQKWPRRDSWESGDIVQNLPDTRKLLKTVKDWDLLERRKIQYRIIKITENIIK